MMLSSLQVIAAGALSLDERIELEADSAAGCFRRSAAALNVSPELLALSVSYYQCDSPDKLLIEIDPAAMQPLPMWAEQLGEMLSFWRSSPQPQSAFGSEVFSEIVEPWLAWAEGNLRSSLPAIHSAILRDGLTYLSERLMTLCARCLATDFSRFKQTLDGASHSTYSAYLTYLYDGGIDNFFMNYPVLGLQVSMEIINWCANLKSLSTHLREDAQALFEADLLQSGEMQLTSLQMGLSDPHRQGQTVCRLQFADRHNLIYKPRSIEAEEAYGRFLQGLGQILHGLLPHRRLAVLSRSDHGWVGFVTFQPCDSKDQIVAYYRRFGQLLAINYLLGVGDIHAENVIADGDEPRILDLEVCLRVPLASQLGSQSGVMGALLDSVIFTNMLPSWELLAEGEARDQSGWSSAELRSSMARNEWYWSEDDRLGLRTHMDNIPSTHLPMLNGRCEVPADWLHAIDAGMKSVLCPLSESARLRKQVQALVSQVFVTISVRFVFRNTVVYGRLLDRLTSPSCNTSGLERSFAIMALTEAMRTENLIAIPSAQEVLRKIVAAEIRMVECNQIPCFHVRSNETTLATVLNPICHAFPHDGLQGALDRIGQLDVATLERQLDWTIGAYEGKFQRDNALSLRHRVLSDSLTDMEEGIADLPAFLAEESNRLEALLGESAIYNNDGSCNWMSMQPVGAAGHVRLALLDASLYDGLSGLAIFLAMRIARGADSARPLLMGVVRTLIGQQGIAGAKRVGYGTGLGGVVSALAWVRAHVALPGLDARLDAELDKAYHPATLQQWITQTPQAVSDFDLLDGLCGGILGYLEAARVLSDQRFRVAAISLAEPLLTHADSAFRVLSDAYGSSLAHGCEGLRLACDRLLEVLPDGVQRENCLALSERCDNFAPSGAGAKESVGSWCHGLTGAMAARKRGAGPLWTELAENVRAELGGAGHLCCGELGRLDVLLEQTLLDNDQASRDILVSRFACWVREAHRAGRYPFYLRGPLSLCTGLFTGITGVGYLCERFLRPEGTPHILGLRLALHNKEPIYEVRVG